MSETPSRPRVALLAMGGTIASAAVGPGGVSPSLDAEDLVASVPGLNDVAEVTARSVARVPGAHLSLSDVLGLAESVEQAVRAGAAGVVITQGTDTIEETAFALDLLSGSRVPVVVTGAMRDPTLAGADGPGNLVAATATAASPHARGLGALVVMNDEIHAARFVRKTHTSNPAAFSSYPGPIGWVSERTARIVVRPVGRLRLPPPAGSLPRVGLVTLAMGDDGSLVGSLEGAALDGLVVEALGGGHVPPAVVEPLSALALRVPVVVTSTTRRGELLRVTYGFVGSETDLSERGVVSGGWLDARKARLLLVLLLGTGADRGVVEATFADPYGATTALPGASGGSA